MTEEMFWDLIEKSMDDTFDDDYQVDCLKKALAELTLDQIVEFDQWFTRLHRAADKGPLWAAGMLLNSGHATDDGFLYFRSWLISCGKDVYYQALVDPDSLVEADFSIDDEGRPYAEYEDFGYAAADVYESLSGGGSIFDALPSTKAESQEEADWDWSEYDNPRWLQAHLPKLWDNFGRFKLEFDQFTQ